MFRSSRLRLTFTYSLITFIVIVALIVSVRLTLEESLFSEQDKELSDVVDSVAEAQAYQIQHPNAAIDESRYYRNVNDRLFFYIFDSYDQLVDFVRASQRIEPAVLSNIKSGEFQNGETKTIRLTYDSERPRYIMMSFRRIFIGDVEQRIYVGKDVTAMYSGLRKATYKLLAIGVLALAATTGIGYVMAGRAIVA